MTQSTPQPPEYPPGPGGAGGETTGKAAGRGARIVRFTRAGRARWVALGLVVAAAGTAGVAAVTVAHHDHDHARTRAERAWDRFDVERRAVGPDGDGPMADGRMTAPVPGRPGLKGERGLVEKPGRAGQEEGPVVERPDRAPVPLPALPAAQALEKALAAVPGGKAEALRVIAQEGGGSAWRVVVLGSDGVRHVVTLAGTDGAVTSNTVAGKAAAAER